MHRVYWIFRKVTSAVNVFKYQLSLANGEKMEWILQSYEKEKETKKIEWSEYHERMWATCKCALLSSLNIWRFIWVQSDVKWSSTNYVFEELFDNLHTIHTWKCKKKIWKNNLRMRPLRSVEASLIYMRFAFKSKYITRDLISFLNQYVCTEWRV